MNTLTRSTLLILLAACDPAPVRAPAADPAPSAAEADPSAPSATRIEVPASVRRNLGINFSAVEVRDLERTLRVPGSFELLPDARREYRMALPGHVELAVAQYERVEPGQLLFRYRSPTWPELVHEILEAEQAVASAEAGIAVSEARREEARRQLDVLRERTRTLAEAEFRRADLEADLATREASLPRLDAELALARTSLDNARSAHQHALHRAATVTGLDEDDLIAVDPDGPDALPAYRSLDKLEVRAQEAGVVELLAATDGAFVEPPGLVLRTVDPDRLRFRALALQADLPRLAEARDARVVPPLTPGLDAATPLPATLQLGLEAHPEERTISLLATPTERAPWARPGVSAFLELVTSSTSRPGLAVPSACVVRDGLEHVVFRRDPSAPDVVLRVSADLGLDDGRWVELRSGVMRGDEVVRDGAYELLLASQQRGGGAPTGGGHVHADGTVHQDH